MPPLDQQDRGNNRSYGRDERDPDQQPKADPIVGPLDQDRRNRRGNGRGDMGVGLLRYRPALGGRLAQAAASPNPHPSGLTRSRRFNHRPTRTPVLVFDTARRLVGAARDSRRQDGDLRQVRRR